MSSRRALAMAVAITSSLTICGDAARAEVLVYVDGNAGGVGDGTSWCDAYATLDAALGAIASGTIRVADGTYTPDPTALADPRDATFALKSGVTIEGGYPGCGAADPDERDIEAHPTILTGDSSGDDDSGGDNSENCYHVVTAGGVDETAVLDGCRITGGNADGSSVGGRNKGGGILIASSSHPRISPRRQPVVASK